MSYSDFNLINTYAPLVVLLLSLVSFQVGAVAIADNAFDRFLINATGAGQTTVSFGGNGALVSTPATANIYTTGGAGAFVERAGSIANPSGVKVPITAVGRVSGAAAGSLFKKALAVSPLGNLVALVSLAAEIGYIISPVPGGGVSIVGSAPGACTVSPCYKWPRPSGGAADGLLLFSTAQAAADAFLSINGSNAVAVLVDGDATYQHFEWRDSSGNVTAVLGSTQTYISRQEVAPDTASSVTPDNLADAIASQSGWPASSSLPQAIKESQAVTGDVLPLVEPAVTGPATSPGAVKTTVNPDGTTTTKTTTHNHTYQGSNISTSSVTVTNNYNPVTNVTNTTTETETPLKPEEAQTDCEKFPDSNGCRKDEFDTPDGDISKTTRNVDYQEMNLGFGGGSCPADVFVFAGGQNLKVWDWVDTCSKVQTYVKPLILLLASVSAMMIIFVGVKTE